MHLTLDHVGIVVPNLVAGRDVLAGMFGIDHWSAPSTEPELGVLAQFGWDAAGFAYELLAPSEDASPFGEALCGALVEGGRGKGSVLQHIAYRSPDFDAAAAAFRRQGSQPLGAARPAGAFAGHRVAFFLTPLGFVCELIEEDGPPAGGVWPRLR